VWKKGRVMDVVKKSDSASGLFSNAVSTAEVKCMKGAKCLAKKKDIPVTGSKGP
jgi:hypothetical protein